MNPVLLSTYSGMGMMEIAFKLVFIVTVYRKKVSVAERCTRSYFVPEFCAGWQVDDLNLTNSIVFHIISSIAMSFLSLFAFQLSSYARQQEEIRKKRVTGIDNYSYSMTSVDTIAYHSGRWRPPNHEEDEDSSATSSDLQSVVGPEAQDAEYGTFRRFCSRVRSMANHHSV